MTDQTDIERLVEWVTARTGYLCSMGARVLAAEKGRVRLAVDRRDDLLQFNGFFHGGVIGGLADHAAGGAVSTALPNGKIAVTVDLHVSYLAPADGAVLVADAHAEQVGSTICVARVEVSTERDDGPRHARSRRRRYGWSICRRAEPRGARRRLDANCKKNGSRARGA